MPFELQNSYFFYITKLSNNTIVKNRKVGGLQKRRVRQLYNKSRLMWFLFQLGFPPKQTRDKTLGARSLVERWPQGTCGPTHCLGGKSARHKTLEANGGAAGWERGNPGQPAKGRSGLCGKGPANVPCCPHGARHQVCGLKISPKMHLWLCSRIPRRTWQRFQQWPLKSESGWMITKMSPTLDSSLYQCPCKVTLQLPPSRSGVWP